MTARKITFAALAVALVFLFTLINIPIPFGGGYVHLGDTAIYLVCCLLPLPAAIIAGGIGSCLADLALGYGFYAPFTLVVKALMALIASLMLRKHNTQLYLLAAFVVSGMFMQVAYLGVNVLYFGEAVTVAAFLFGCIQTVVAIPLAMLACGLLLRNKTVCDLCGTQLRAKKKEKPEE